MYQQIQNFFNISVYTSFSKEIGVRNKYFSKNISFKPPLHKDTITFSGINSYVIPGYPDLKQHDILGWEEYYCGPVSAANGILSLKNPNLQDDNLINTLAAHFKTNRDGTSINNLCSGVSSFLQEKGINNFNVEYQGAMEAGNYKTINIPDLTKIKSELPKPGFIILTFGFYKKTGYGKNVKYERSYGHCVNAIGYQEDTKNSNNNLLIINDPYKRTKGELNLKLKKVPKGKLLNNKDDTEKMQLNQAKGLYEVSGLPYLRKGQVALLDGVVFVNIK